MMKCSEVECPHCNAESECEVVHDENVYCTNPDFIAERNKMN